MAAQGRVPFAFWLAAIAAASAATAGVLALVTVRAPWIAIAAVAAAVALVAALVTMRRWHDLEGSLAQQQRRTAALAGERDQLLRTLQQQDALEQELLQAKQAAETAVLAKGEFLATMSHEIRTPLNGILPMLDLIARGQLASDQRQMLQTATVSSQQLLRIVDDILDYSRLEAKGLDLETTTFNLRELLEGLVQLMRRTAEAKRLALTLELDPSVRLAVRGDPVRLRQVLGNLLVNAIKFTERGGIRLRVSRQGESGNQHLLRFEVIDSGIGIEPAMQSRLFQSFSQADASTTRIYGGTGLGLAICKRIIDLMHGRIGVSSTPGHGANFWFEIPLLKVAGDLPPPSATTRGLLVSQDPLLIQRLQRVTLHHDIRLHTVESASAALDILRAPSRRGIEPDLTWVIADADALRHGATALHRSVLREPREPRPQLLWLEGTESLAALLHEDALAVSRDVGDIELHALLRPPQHSARPASLLVNVDDYAEPVEAQQLGLNLLLVEDNSVNLLVAQRLLQVLGCTVTTATDGEQALQALQTQSFDLVLMDCQMPVVDGYTATRRWRSLEAESRVGRLPIVAMTANAMAGDRERCLQAGMDDYLSKPVNRESLQACLLRWQQNAENNAATLAVLAEPPPAPTPPPLPPLNEAPLLRGLEPEARGEDPTQVVLDPAVLDELQEVIGPETAHIIRVFLDDTPPLIRQLQDASVAGDLEHLRNLAHSLKSASANVGAMALSMAALRIEQDARGGSLERPAVAVALLVAEFARARIALAGYESALRNAAAP